MNSTTNTAPTAIDPVELDLRIQAALDSCTDLKRKNSLYRQYRTWTRTGVQGHLIRQIASA